MIKVAPSILTSDYTRLGTIIKELEEAGSDRVHLDVMDGHFVPRISFGDPVIESIAKVCKIPLEAHLMVLNPEKYLPCLSKLSVSTVIVHYECNPHVHKVIQNIRSLGMKAGIAINPGTPWLVISEIIELCDIVLVMTINPGMGGQTILPKTLLKVKAIREFLNINSLTRIELEVDGGVNKETAKECVESGADVLVAGSYLTGCDDLKERVSYLNNL